ncbi:MAG TPA: ribokinase [Terriglobia bacterium]|nr:ribokinase [Terriglobia bacterium]
MRKPIVVVGSVNLDLVGCMDRIPAVGETVTGSRFELFHGGKGANQAVAAARLRYPVSMVAKVGDDQFGVRLRQGLRSAGVDVRAVRVAKRISSGVALISTDTRGQNSIVVIPGANGKLLPTDLENSVSVLRSAGIILTQLEIPWETVECLAALAQRFDIPLMLDPAPARPIPDDLIQKITFLTPNETETSVICGIRTKDLSPSTAPEIARTLLGRGLQNVVIKMGSRGAYAATSVDSGAFVPAFKVAAVDSTAAGDAFNGGLAVALMKGQSFLTAIRFGSAVAALSVTRMGAQPSMPSAREVNRFLKSGVRASLGHAVPDTELASSVEH